MTATWPAGIAHLEGLHFQVEGGSLGGQELLVGAIHGAALAAAVFLAGLVAFAALVWLPAWRAGNVVGQDAVNLLARLTWPLFGLLTVAGLLDVSLYAVRASGEAFGLGLFGEALFRTRVGNVWLARVALAYLTAFTATRAAKEGRRSAYWLVAVGSGSVMLVTLTQLSHAAAEGRSLPFFADWLHVMAASVWMGGLLGFPALLLGPLRSMPSDSRAKVLAGVVRRFSKVATMAVITILATGLYVALLHVPDFSALLGTAYGRALVAKLGLLVILLAAGGTNLLLRGRGPFGRVVVAELVLALGIFVATGFLTSLPPASAVWQEVPVNGDEVAKLTLEPANGSAVVGTATFTEVTDGVEVELDVSGLPKPSAVYLAHIHEGACSGEGRGDASNDHARGHRVASKGEIDHPISPVGSGPGGEGASTTLLWDTTFDEIFSSGGSLIVHAAGQGETPQALACGDLGEAERAK